MISYLTALSGLPQEHGEEGGGAGDQAAHAGEQAVHGGEQAAHGAAEGAHDALSTETMMHHVTNAGEIDVGFTTFHLPEFDPIQ